jgi:hypothetical protein
MAHTIQNTERANMTSFHGTEFRASANEIIAILGEPTYDSNDGSDKVNLEWICETETGEVFTIYDWKEYRPIEMDEKIDWHIGGHNGRVTNAALKELEKFGVQPLENPFGF